MSDIAGPLSTDKFQSNHVYQSERFVDLHGNTLRLNIGVFGNSEDGYDVNYRYYLYDKEITEGELFSKHVKSEETAGRLFWERLNLLPQGTIINELYTNPDKIETNQGERNVTTKPAQEKSTANDVKEGIKEKPAEKPEKFNTDRTTNETPQTETKEEYTGGTLLEDIEHWIPSLTENAHKGVQSLKNDLDNYVQDGGNWLGAALAGTALDTIDTAMFFIEGIPLGFLDTRNIGDGLAEGTWEGAKKDISRALNVLPQGKILKAIDRAITVSGVVESIQEGSFQNAGINIGMGILATATHAKGKSNKTASKADHLNKEQIKIVDYLQSDVFNKSRFELVKGFAKGEPGLKNIPSAASTSLHDRAKMDLKNKFKSSIKIEDNVLLRKMGKQNIDLSIEINPSVSTSKLKIELKSVAWLDKGKIKTPWTVKGRSKSQRKQMAAIQLSAKKDISTPHLIVTPTDTFFYVTSERAWIKLQ